MIKDNAREKLINSIIYFASHTDCPKTKLLKLLYMLDFEHFKQTGRSVTGLIYYAWRLGPVPTSVRDELQAQDSELRSAVDLVPAFFYGYPGERVVAKKPFRAEIFTRRELGLMESIALKHREKTANNVIDATHEKGGPWDMVYAGSKGRNAPIPYDLALAREPDEEARAVKARQRERAEFLTVLKP